jgi:hypothetical protein
MAEERLELNDSERAWLDGLLESGRAMVQSYGHDVADAELPALDQLDAVLPVWAEEPVETRTHANDVVLAFGAVLGAHLCRELGLSWILVSDEHGTELAVHGDPGDVLIFPANAVAKRVSEGQSTFFVAFADEAVAQVRRIRGG